MSIFIAQYPTNDLAGLVICIPKLSVSRVHLSKNYYNGYHSDHRNFIVIFHGPARP